MSTAHWQGHRLPIPAAWPVRSSPTVHQWAIISAGLAPILLTGAYLIAGILQPVAAITTAGRDLLDKTTPVLTAIAHEHIASRLPDAALGKLTKTLRTIAGTSPPEASQRRGETT
jgi:hypothetical protein